MIVPQVLPCASTHLQVHRLSLDPACPRSKNPRPGSTITLAYRPRGYALEVGALYAYIHQFRGGLHQDDGTLVVREMEAMIARVAEDCTEVLQVPVRVRADLLLLPWQEMFLSVRRSPCRERSDVV